jgi:hypothetical protein
MNKLLLLFVLFGVCANTVYGHDENGTQPLATRIGADNVSWNCSLARRSSTEIRGSNYYDDVLYFNTKNYVLACPLYAESEVTARDIKVLPYYVENSQSGFAKKNRDKLALIEHQSKLIWCKGKMAQAPLSMNKDELLMCTYQTAIRESGCLKREICPDFNAWLRQVPILATGSPEAVRINQSLFLDAQRTIRDEVERTRGPFIVLVQGYRYVCDINKLNPVLIGANIAIRPDVTLSEDRRLVCRRQAVSYVTP